MQNQNLKNQNTENNQTDNNTEKAEQNNNANETLTEKIEKQINDKESEVKDEATEFKDKYLRTLAELENIKKYSAKQIEETSHYAINKFAKELLMVMDVFNKALSSINISEIKDESFKTFANGIDLTKQELEKIFKKFDIKALDNSIIGQAFNPNFHEALMSKADSTKEDNTIFEVFEPGYIIKERLLRPAKVIIVKNS